MTLLEGSFFPKVKLHSPEVFDHTHKICAHAHIVDKMADAATASVRKRNTALSLCLLRVQVRDVEFAYVGVEASQPTRSSVFSLFKKCYCFFFFYL